MVSFILICIPKYTAWVRLMLIWWIGTPNCRLLVVTFIVYKWIYNVYTFISHYEFREDNFIVTAKSNCDITLFHVSFQIYSSFFVPLVHTLLSLVSSKKLRKSRYITPTLLIFPYGFFFTECKNVGHARLCLLQLNPNIQDYIFGLKLKRYLYFSFHRCCLACWMFSAFPIFVSLIFFDDL